MLVVYTIWYHFHHLFIISILKINITHGVMECGLRWPPIYTSWPPLLEQHFYPKRCVTQTVNSCFHDSEKQQMHNRPHACFIYILEIQVIIWFIIWMAFSMLLTALIQPVQPINVILAHLGGLPKGDVAVGDGHHSGLAIFGEGIPVR